VLTGNAGGWVKGPAYLHINVPSEQMGVIENCYLAIPHAIAYHFIERT
jgi:phosphoheptose isomerase